MDAADHPLAADHTRTCTICGGPCSFGGAENAAAVWNPPRPVVADLTLPMTAMIRDEALQRLGTELPREALASIHLSEFAIANHDVAEDLRAGHPARIKIDWSVLIQMPGVESYHTGRELPPVIEKALADFRNQHAARYAEEWARTAVPDKPPKLTAPTTADAERDTREKNAG